MENVKSVGLSKSLNLLETIAIGVSDISPVTGVFLMVPALLAMVGTGSLTVALISGLIALCVALTMGELGAMFPEAGGIYSIIRRVLGPTMGFITLIAYLSEGIFIPSVVALGSASYVVNIFPGLNVAIVAVVIMLLATGVTILNISAGAKFTTVLLTLELLLVGVMTIFGFIHVRNSPSSLFSMQMIGSGGSLVHVGPGLLFAGISVMLFSFNGYDSALTFSEESSGEVKNVGKSVVRTAITGILAQIIPIIAITMAAPSITAMLTSKAPISYVGHSILGGSFDVLINVGAAIAMFACTIAVLMQFSRVLYSSGRNGAWPNAISRAFASLHPKLQSPWISSMVLGVLGAFLCFASNLGNLITFTSVVIVLLYGLIAVCSFVVHFKYKNVARPYKIPFWPIPPALALIGAIATLTQQTSRDLITAACILIAAALYYVFYLKRKEQSALANAADAISPEL